MSAYVVDRLHIQYLIAAAYFVKLRWYYDKEWRKCETVEDAVKLGKLLWSSNIVAVKTRYRDSTVDTLPGPINETFELTERDVKIVYSVDPVELLSSCVCYDYQTCEMKDYRDSEAWEIIDKLRDAYIRRLPGYSTAAWGAPQSFINKYKPVSTRQD